MQAKCHDVGKSKHLCAHGVENIIKQMWSNFDFWWV